MQANFTVSGCASAKRSYRAKLLGITLLGLLTTLTAAIAPATAERPLASHAIFNALVAEGGIEIQRGTPFGPSPRQQLDIYRAPAGQERRPIVVFYYGGSWRDGERQTYAFVGAALAKRGYITVIPDYRLFPEVKFPGFVDDAARAYAWVHDNLARSQGGASACATTVERPIIVIGHSAGAYNAAMVALDRAWLTRDGKSLPQPAAFVSLAGPLAFDPTTWPSTKAVFAPAAARPDITRPVMFARKNAPPTLLLHGEADETVKLYNSNDVLAALKAGGNDVSLKTYPGIGHVGLVLAIARPFRWRAPVLDDMVAFMDRHGGTELLDRACVPKGRPKSDPTLEVLK